MHVLALDELLLHKAHYQQGLSRVWVVADNEGWNKNSEDDGSNNGVKLNLPLNVETYDWSGPHDAQVGTDPIQTHYWLTALT